MPRTAVEGGRRLPVSFRVTPEMRDRLRSAANGSGRSVAQEIEHRLERETDLDLMFGSPELRATAMVMAHAFAFGGALKAEPTVAPPREWLLQPDAVISAITEAVIEAAVMCGLSRADRRKLARAIEERLSSLDQGRVR